jgi:hypothetical protein
MHIKKAWLIAVSLTVFGIFFACKERSKSDVAHAEDSSDHGDDVSVRVNGRHYYCSADGGGSEGTKVYYFENATTGNNCAPASLRATTAFSGSNLQEYCQQKAEAAGNPIIRCVSSSSDGQTAPKITGDINFKDACNRYAEGL